MVEKVKKKVLPWKMPFFWAPSTQNICTIVGENTWLTEVLVWQWENPSLKGSHSKSSNWWAWQPLIWQLSHKTHSMMCHHPKWCAKRIWVAQPILLMEEILHHLECKKTCKQWDGQPINWLAGFGSSTNITIYNHQRVARTKDVNNDVWSSKNGLLLAVLVSIYLQVVQRKSYQDASW